MNTVTGIPDIRSLIDRPGNTGVFAGILKKHGESACFQAFDDYLGDYPDSSAIRKVAAIWNPPEEALWSGVDSVDEARRRITRILLLEKNAGVSDDSRLQKGLSDSSAMIRCDASRFCAAGTDRTRLYNQLIRLIRDDPDKRVRSAAGRRLATNFADLYSVDFDGLPTIARMLILDALEGHTRVDEERAESLLIAGDAEAAFRAARCLLRWGTLARCFSTGENDPILEKAASLGVVDYLETADGDRLNRERALRYAAVAGREDLVRRLQAVSDTSGNQSVTDGRWSGIASVVLEMANLDETRRNQRITELPLDDPALREAVARAFPDPVNDISAVVVYSMVAAGRWTDWTDRVVSALVNPDPDIRCSAAAALSVIDPSAAVDRLPCLLTDPVYRVAMTAARVLASLPSGAGGAVLAEHLSTEDEESGKPVFEGIRNAGGTALVRCILDHAEMIDESAAGQLLSLGFDDVGAELLVDGIQDEGRFARILGQAGLAAGRSLVSAWPKFDDGGRKRTLTALAQSGWPDQFLKDLSARPAREVAQRIVAFGKIDPDERRRLFEAQYQEARGQKRRHLRRIMKA